MIDHQVTMRWGDMDMYAHVNNVRYLDYAAESREQLVDAGHLSPDHHVSGIDVDYLRPLLLTRSPIVVTCDLADDLLTQEICLDSDEGRTVHARVVTHLGERSVPVPVEDVDGVLQGPVQIRLCDLGPAAVVTPERAAEVVQELRIAHKSRVIGQADWSPSLVGGVRLAFHGPLTRDVDGLVARTWVSHVGRSSYHLELEIRREQQVLLRGTSLMVAIDAQTQRPKPLTEQERAPLVIVHP